MSQNWIIRPAETDDVSALSLVGGATFLETFAGTLNGRAIVDHCEQQHSAEIYQKYLDGGSKAWLGEAATGGAPVGFALLSPPDLPGAEEGDIELKRIYILSRFHGSGMAAALMQAVVDASAGFRRLLLGVYRQNDRAIAFYRKQGFELAGERQFNVGGTLYDDIVLAKPLNS